MRAYELQLTKETGIPKSSVVPLRFLVEKKMDTHLHTHKTRTQAPHSSVWALGKPRKREALGQLNQKRDDLVFMKAELNTTVKLRLFEVEQQI